MRERERQKKERGLVVWAGAILTIQTDPLFSSHASVVAFRVLESRV